MSKHIRILTGASVLISLVLLSGCHKKGETMSSARVPTATVKVMTVANKKYLAEEEVLGSIHAKLRATIEAKISGRIESMPVVVGQHVKSGELLVLLDAREIQAKLDQTKAVRDQNRQDLNRFEALLKQSAVTQQEFDGVQARSRVADASVVEAEAMLGYAKIAAPFSGVVSRKLVDVGDLATPSRPLLELEDPSVMRLEADIPETLITRVRLGEKMMVRVSSLTNDFEGIVCEIAPTADPYSRTIRAKLDLPATPDLRIGQFGRVAVLLNEINTVRVPASAVVVRGQMEIVFVVRNQKAELRLVKTGKRFGSEWEIVSGLNPDEQVVTEGASRLQDGQPVEVQR
jgi:RND family efflux transporter MFP subunit